MRRCNHNCRCKWLISVNEVVHFDVTVVSWTVHRPKTKQFTKAINCNTSMKICHKIFFLIDYYVVFVVVFVTAVLAGVVDKNLWKPKLALIIFGWWWSKMVWSSRSWAVKSAVSCELIYEMSWFFCMLIQICES